MNQRLLRAAHRLNFVEYEIHKSEWRCAEKDYEFIGTDGNFPVTIKSISNPDAQVWNFSSYDDECTCAARIAQERMCVHEIKWLMRFDENRFQQCHFRRDCVEGSLLGWGGCRDGTRCCNGIPGRSHGRITKLIWYERWCSRWNDKRSSQWFRITTRLPARHKQFCKATWHKNNKTDVVICLLGLHEMLEGDKICNIFSGNKNGKNIVAWNWKSIPNEIYEPNKYQQSLQPKWSRKLSSTINFTSSTQPYAQQTNSDVTPTFAWNRLMKYIKEKNSNQ